MKARRARLGWLRWAAALIGAVALVRLGAVTLVELENDPKMSPKRFGGYFGTFDFEAHDEVQLPEVFLSTRRGDCDDYAILADHILRRRGFGTRLIHVRFVGQVAHAVCYIDANRAYLDYNNRIYYVGLERCGPRLRDIAASAADLLHANWTSVSEFTYDYHEDRKHFQLTVVKTEPPSDDPDFNSASASK